MAARNAEIVYKPFYEGKGRHKDFYKGKWPRAARKFFRRLFIKGQEVNSNFCLFVVNVLGSRCSLFSRFSLFDFPGLCFKVENDKILFTAKNCDGVWSFLSLPFNPPRG